MGNDYQTRVFNIEVADGSETLFEIKTLMDKSKATNTAKLLKSRFPECDVYLTTVNTTINSTDSIEEVEL